MRKYLIAGMAMLAAAALFCGCRTGERAEVPEWRGKAPGTAYLGDDVLWRPRENLIFHMMDQQGSGFKLRFTVRDLNTYVHAPAPVFFQVVGPDDRILARAFLEDDGVTGGDFARQDGHYDPYADFRYRQFHRANSPGGVPPEKERSPYLEHPEKLPFRVVELEVPADGPGLYRVLVTGRYDHFISMTPDRPIPTGIYPGTGPLNLAGNHLEKSFFYLPDTPGDVALALSEETLPYAGKLALRDGEGRLIREAEADGFYTFLFFDDLEKGRVYQLDIANANAGMGLHGAGFPFVFAPDAETAKLLAGGLKFDSRKRYGFHDYVATLNRWRDGVKPEELAAEVAFPPEIGKLVLKGRENRKIAVGEVAALLAKQNLDPSGPDYGAFPAVKKGPKLVNLLEIAAGEPAEGKNPYYGHPALIRRLLLARIPQLVKLSAAYRFDGSDLGFRKPEQVGYFTAGSRSNWYGLGLDAEHVSSLLAAKGHAAAALPAEVLEAWKTPYRLWASGRFNMHAGEVANQWGYNTNILMQIAEALDDPAIAAEIRRFQRLVTTVGLYGRVNPDATPFDKKRGKLDTDCGLTPSGYMPEQLGFDGEYTCEQTMLWGWIWRKFPDDSTVKWFNAFNTLKTHLTLPKGAEAPQVTFSQTCSPTDLNFRTRYMTHKNHQPPEMIGKVDYLDLWFPQKGRKSAKPWPCLETAEFVRVIDDKFFFVNSGDFYAILYGGPREPRWSNWGAESLCGDSLNFDGPNGMGYGGWGTANKPGGISALYLRGVGPVVFGQNHSVMDSDTVWGRAKQPLFAAWRREDCDPRIFAACYAQPEVTFDAAAKRYTLTEKIPYVPLEVKRTISFAPDTVRVEAGVRALEDFSGAELNWSLPFFADNRRVLAGQGGKFRALEIPEPQVTPSRPRFPDAALEKARCTAPGFRADAIRLLDRHGKKGVEVKFDAPGEFRLLNPIRYREVAPAGGALMRKLPAELKKGEEVKFGYTITAWRSEGK